MLASPLGSACDGDGDADAGLSPDAARVDGGSELRTDGGPGVPIDGALAIDAGPGVDAGGPLVLVMPPANGQLDYQLGGAYAPPAGVAVLSRDRLDSPASGVYSICYVNGFQTQPGEGDFWMDEHPELLLRDADGELVIDPDWEEIMLDVTTPEKRAALAGVVGGWIDACADAGFDAIEIDNLDTYSRSGGLVTQDQAVAFMRALADRAHARGLPIAQKNSAELLGRRAEMGTDFVVVEECNRYEECADFTGAYGDQVYVIEYRRSDFDAGCRDFPNLSTVLRDRDLQSPSESAYVYDAC